MRSQRAGERRSEGKVEAAWGEVRDRGQPFRIGNSCDASLKVDKAVDPHLSHSSVEVNAAQAKHVCERLLIDRNLEGVAVGEPNLLEAKVQLHEEMANPGR